MKRFLLGEKKKRMKKIQNSIAKVKCALSKR